MTKDKTNIYLLVGISLIAIFLLIGKEPELTPGPGLVDNTTTTTILGDSCEWLYWFDATYTTSCSYYNFCGDYMYDGLQTFTTSAECESARVDFVTADLLTITQRYLVWDIKDDIYVDEIIRITVSECFEDIHQYNCEMQIYCPLTYSNNAVDYCVISASRGPGDLNLDFDGSLGTFNTAWTNAMKSCDPLPPPIGNLGANVDGHSWYATTVCNPGTFCTVHSQAQIWYSSLITETETNNCLV